MSDVDHARPSLRSPPEKASLNGKRHLRRFRPSGFPSMLADSRQRIQSQDPAMRNSRHPGDSSQAHGGSGQRTAQPQTLRTTLHMTGGRGFRAAVRRAAAKGRPRRRFLDRRAFLTALRTCGSRWSSKRCLREPGWREPDRSGAILLPRTATALPYSCGVLRPCSC